MASYFPSTWNKYYGDAHDDNEQWLLWRRFLVRYQVEMAEIESLCDKLVDSGERFAPNQGAVAAILQNIRGQKQDAFRQIYQSTLHTCYQLQFNPDKDVTNEAALKALSLSGGFAWHNEMHTANKNEQAFILWLDRYQHLLESSTDVYQHKIGKRKSPIKSSLRETDEAMILLALKRQGHSQELQRFAQQLGMTTHRYQQLVHKVD